ncbi:MAG: rod-binding protein [Rhizobiaceae bacterium]|nr:rod-binding protein [Rhizobiaceae bacterium]
MTVVSPTQGASVAVPEAVEVNRARPSAAATAVSGKAFEDKLDAAKGVSERPVSAVYRGSKSGQLTPVQQFESFVLRSFVETMLPDENTSFFGTGTAGNIWKSMLAERIGEEMARDGGIGIADLLSKREANAKAMSAAKAELDTARTLDIGADTLQRAGAL